jgi:hypothetical protein
MHALEPGSDLLPPPAVHPDLTPLAALAVANQDGAALGIEIALAQGERLTDPKPGAPDHDDQTTKPDPVGASPAARMTAMISSTVGGWGG